MRTYSSFPMLLKLKEKLRVLLNKVFLMEKKMTENINYSRREMKFASVDDPLNMYRNASSETAYVFEITNITNEENVTIAPGQRKVPVSI